MTSDVGGCIRLLESVYGPVDEKEVPASARVGLLNIKTDIKSINQIYCTVKYI